MDQPGLNQPQVDGEEQGNVCSNQHRPAESGTAPFNSSHDRILGHQAPGEGIEFFERFIAQILDAGRVGSIVGGILMGCVVVVGSPSMGTPSSLSGLSYRIVKFCTSLRQRVISEVSRGHDRVSGTPSAAEVPPLARHNQSYRYASSESSLFGRSLDLLGFAVG